MSCCKNRNLEVIAKTMELKTMPLGQTIYARCTNCETIYHRLKIFNKLTLYVKYDGKLTAEQLKELAPKCVETIHRFIELQYLQRKGKI